MALSLALFPEELVARILALALAPPRPTARDPSRNRLALLLVSRQFFRIAAPIVYHTLRFHSPRQARCAHAALTRFPALASDVRKIVFDGIWHDCAGVLALCNYLQDVDICLTGHPAREPRELELIDSHDADAEAFCDALERRRTIAHLTIRKDPAVYLTHPRPVYVLQRLAQAVRHWTDLQTVHLALRVSASPSTIALARALSTAPRLRSIRAQLPAVWNTFLLVLSTNPRLERVMLYAEPISGPRSAVMSDTGDDVDIEHAVLGTGLYMMEVKKHARFSELVKAGTSVIRTRAHTTIATLSPPSAGSTPLGAARAKEVAVELMTRVDTKSS